MAEVTVTPEQEAAPSGHDGCPKCGYYQLTPASRGRQRCTACGWRGWVFHFSPPPRPLDQPQAAMPDDVTCAYHPTKRATQVCEGTGNYICPLCAVEVDGKTYSADFINRGGLKKKKQNLAFEQKLARPDLAITYCVLASVFPYTAIFGPAWLILALIQYAKHRRLLREEPIYPKVLPRGARVALALTFGIWIGLYVLLGAMLAMWILSSDL